MLASPPFAHASGAAPLWAIIAAAVVVVIALLLLFGPTGQFAFWRRGERPPDDKPA